MIIVIIALGLGLLVNVGVQKLVSLDAPPAVVEKVCPPHAWGFDSNEKLVCGICKMRPGEAQTRNGEY